VQRNYSMRCQAFYNAFTVLFAAFYDTKPGFHSKCYTMKISKSLLIAIAAAVVVTTVTSCTKDKPEKKDEKKNERTVPQSCPACGMG